MNKFYLFFVVILLQAAPTLAKTYDLEIKKQNSFVTGKAVEAIAINGQIPGPTLRFVEGEEVVIRVKNSLDETTSLHWHGILLAGKMDGVPGLNGFEGIAAGETFTYKFKIRQSGTYWYHAHSNLQEQRGVYGAIVINEKSGSPYLGGASRRVSATMGVNNSDHVVVLSDFSEETPQQILANLKLDSGYYNYHKRTLGDFFADSKKNGFFATLKDRMMWGQMRMDATDLADVSKYHFLVNGKNTDENWTAIFKKNQPVRLRFVNASAMTFFDVSIPNLKMKLIAADGQNVQPVAIDEFRIAPAETYDVIVEPKENKAYTIFAESLDRTGYARATLAPKAGMVGEIPQMRERTVLNMSDMGMEGDENSAAKGWADASTPLGHKALSYSDLISAQPQKDLRQPIREIEFHFGGTMNRYIWTINGEKFPKPTHLKFGERVRLKFINDTMMAHPVHLHGMFTQLENGQKMKWLPNKHTVIAPPGKTVSVLLTADETGEWSFHCHLLYHMASGMMSSVVVEKGEKNE